MAIDISTDLIIQANGSIVTTPTMNGVYDAGGVPGQYDPGKDYSTSDNVSKGLTATYAINISLNSQSNQTYPIDKLTIGSADQNGNLSFVKIYSINDDPNAANIIDTGTNTLAANSTTLVPVVLTSGLASNSTLTTNLIFNLPGNAFWKTKIQPQVIIIAEKDGIQKTLSAGLPLVKLAPKSYFRSTIDTPPVFNVTYSAGLFSVPFYVLSEVQAMTNITRLANNPDFASVTYSIDLSVKVNDTVGAPITSFTFAPPSDCTVSSYSYTGTVLTMTVVGPYKTIVSQQFRTDIMMTASYIPLPGESNALVTFMGSWVTGTPVSVVANNNYQILYELLNNGSINRFARFVDLTNGGIGALRLRQVIENGGLYTNAIDQYVAAIHDDLLYKAIDSQYVLLVDSPISALRPAAVPKVLITFTDRSGAAQSKHLDASYYTQTFAYVPTTGAGYNPNNVIQDILTGVIASGSYASIIASGRKPTARISTLIKDPWIGTNFDPMKEHQITFDDTTFDPLSAAAFKTLYDADPTNPFTTYLHSYSSLNTFLSSVAEAEALFGQLLATMDNFQLRNGSVFLNLGTTVRGDFAETVQFNDISIVQNTVAIPVWYSEFENGIIFATGAQANIIADYSQKYFYVFRRKAQAINYWNTQAIVLQGTPMQFDIPLPFAPYFVIDDTPYLQDENGLKTPILDYQYDGFSIQFNMPVDFTFDFDGPGVYVPLRFIVPSENLSVQFLPPSIPAADIVANLPGSILNHFPSGTPYYHVQHYTIPSELIGVEIDTTGLYVAPKVYANGNSVKYTAVVYNQNFTVSDYYTINTVPTNRYNEIETSNNTQKAHIDKITTFDPATEIYYQLEVNVTAADIAMSKVLQGASNLLDYYNSTIKTTWIKWIPGTALPSQVVMFASFTPAVRKGKFARVDYDVTIQMTLDTTELYINDASFKYDSTGSGLEAHSNIVQVQNIPLPKPPIPVKAAAPMTVDGLLFKDVTFTIQYPLPVGVNTTPTNTLLFHDLVDPAFVVLSHSLNLPTSVYYTVSDLSAGNNVKYQLVTKIPAGQMGNLPKFVTLTILVRYQCSDVCEKTIPNTAYFGFNQMPTTPSNTVEIAVKTPQSIIDVGESVALMQTAIAHILNADGKKLQKIIANPNTTATELVCSNQSVEGMVNSIALLEATLAAKLEYFACEDCCE